MGGRLLGATATVLALAACTAGTPVATPGGAAVSPGPSATGQPATGQSPARTPTTTPTTPMPSATPTAKAQITLAFAGDVHFEEHLRPLARSPHALDTLRATTGKADFTMVNLETAITDRGTGIPGKTFRFRAPASALTTLANAGVDLVSMANNHGVDFGPVGLADTLAAKARSPLPIIGIGANETQAHAPHSTVVGGLKIAFLAGSQIKEETLALYSADRDSGGIANSLRRDRLLAAIRAARRTHDLVVVYLHWGTEYMACPDSLDRETSRLLRDAGVDILVGAHSHVVKGAGWLGSTFVDYGLGNHVWWRPYDLRGQSGVLTLTVDTAEARAASAARRAGTHARSPITAYTWTPLLISKETGIPAAPDAAGRAALMARFEQVRQCARLSATRPQ